MNKIITVFVLFICFHQLSYAQTSLHLIAERKRGKVIFVKDEAVKVVYTGTDSTVKFKGRIAGITSSSLIVQPFKKSKNTIDVPVSDLIQVKRIRRVGRAVGGVIAGFGMAGGIAAIADDLKTRGEWFDGLGVVAGFGTIIIFSLPYTIITATEPNASRLKGYRFYVVQGRD